MPRSNRLAHRLSPVGDVDELGIEADLLAGSPHAAFNDKAHAKIARDIGQDRRPVLVGEDRVAGDDVET